MNPNTLEKGLADATVADLLTGEYIGDFEGGVICDGCSECLEFGSDDGGLESVSMSGYATAPINRPQPWDLSLVYCPECSPTHGNLDTEDADEAIVEFDAVLQSGTPSPRPIVTNVTIDKRVRS